MLERFKRNPAGDNGGAERGGVATAEREPPT